MKVKEPHAQIFTRNQDIVHSLKSKGEPLPNNKNQVLHFHILISYTYVLLNLPINVCIRETVSIKTQSRRRK